MPVSMKLFSSLSPNVLISGIKFVINLFSRMLVVVQSQNKWVNVSSGAGSCFAMVQNVHALSIVLSITM